MILMTEIKRRISFAFFRAAFSKRSRIFLLRVSLCVSTTSRFGKAEEMLWEHELEAGKCFYKIS